MGFVLTVDQWGNGLLSIDGGPAQAIQGSLQPDPSWTGNPPSLTWDLAAAGVAPVGGGDVNVYEPTGTDVVNNLRFTNAAGDLGGLVADRMMYYSIEANGAPADTGFPPNINAGDSAVTTETEPDTFSYSATGVNTYNGVPAAVQTPLPLKITLRGIRRTRRVEENRCESEPAKPTIKRAW